VFLKPVTAILSLIFYYHDLYTEGSFDLHNSFFYMSFTNNVSISISLYCLALFYLGFEKDLKPFRPFSKFLCIKFVLFFSFWQTFFFEMIIHFQIIEIENAKIYQSLLMCFEMMLASIGQSFAFSHTDYVDYSLSDHHIIKNIQTVINVTDLIDDAESTFTKDTDKEDKPLNDINDIK